MQHFDAMIGDFRVRFSMQSIEHKISLMRTFGALSEGGGHARPADLHIRIGKRCGHPFAGFDVDTGADGTAVRFSRTDYRVVADPDLETAVVCAYNDYALKHALLNVMSAFLIRRRWGLVLQAACVADGEGVYAFAGRDGAGKGRVAKRAAPRHVLSDEASLIRICGREATVFDSPFRRQLSADRPVPQLPLKAIAFLHPSSYTEWIRLKPSDAMLHLLDHLFVWPYGQAETGGMLAMCKQLAESVPMHRVHYDDDELLWEKRI